MTVVVQTPYNQHVANGVTTTFGFTFQLLDAGDLQVFVDGVEVGGYSISGLGVQAGGSITFVSPPASLAVVDIRRVIPLARSIDYQQNGDLPSDILDLDLDRLWQAFQDAEFQGSLAVNLPLGDPATPMTLPAATSRAGRFLAFDGSGNAIAADALNGVPVSAFMQTVLDDANENAARATLVAAKSGANTDITSLAGLTTPLSVAQGGSGVAVPETRVLGASVASNALTLTLQPTVLEFRNTTPNNGAVSTVVVPSAISLVVSNGSTLGTTNGILARLAVLALNNAGTVELAVVNLAGGVNLDEAGVISTTAEGGAGAADSVSTIYSTTARSNVAYRLIGFVEATQATAGTWATAPSLIKAGANPLAAWFSGYGQLWQAVTGARALGASYPNSTGREIEVNVQIGNGSATAHSIVATVNGVALMGSSYTTSGSATCAMSFKVPPGGSYVVNGTLGAPTLAVWNELR
jgi:hypothetical protein